MKICYRNSTTSRGVLDTPYSGGNTSIGPILHVTNTSANLAIPFSPVNAYNTAGLHIGGSPRNISGIVATNTTTTSLPNVLHEYSWDSSISDYLVTKTISITPKTTVAAMTTTTFDSVTNYYPVQTKSFNTITGWALYRRESVTVPERTITVTRNITQTWEDWAYDKGFNITASVPYNRGVYCSSMSGNPHDTLTLYVKVPGSSQELTGTFTYRCYYSGGTSQNIPFEATSGYTTVTSTKYEPNVTTAIQTRNYSTIEEVLPNMFTVIESSSTNSLANTFTRTYYSAALDGYVHYVTANTIAGNVATIPVTNQFTVSQYLDSNSRIRNRTSYIEGKFTYKSDSVYRLIQSSAARYGSYGLDNKAYSPAGTYTSVMESVITPSSVILANSISRTCPANPTVSRVSSASSTTFLQYVTKSEHYYSISKTFSTISEGTISASIRNTRFSVVMDGVLTNAYFYACPDNLLASCATYAASWSVVSGSLAVQYLNSTTFSQRTTTYTHLLSGTVQYSNMTNKSKSNTSYETYTYKRSSFTTTIGSYTTFNSIFNNSVTLM